MNKFICYICHGEFEEEWTDEEALEELKQNFGEQYAPEDCEKVCDDCYPMFSIFMDKT